MKRVVLTAGIALLALGLAACSSSTGGTPPASPGEPTVAPDFTPALKAMVSCMADEGFTIVPAFNNGHEGFDSTYPESQDKSYNRADKKCTASTNWGAIPPALTDAQAGKEFDDLVKVAQCLESQGFAIADPPSRQSFVDALVTNNTIWFPYDSILGDGHSYADYQKATKECPQHYTTP